MQIRMKQYRMKRKPRILQREIAEEIKRDPAQISQMENGDYIPSLKTALKIARAFTKLLGEKVYVDDLWQLGKSDR